MEDVSEGYMERYIDLTESVLVFCSRGYFESRNCMRELRLACAKGKPIITILDPESNSGSMSTDEIGTALKESDAYYSSWGFDGDNGPQGAQLIEALFRDEPIEWNRISAFQVRNVCPSA